MEELQKQPAKWKESRHKRPQMQCMLPFLWSVQNRQIHTDRTGISSCLGVFLLAVGWGWELEGVFESVGNVLRLDSDKGPSSQSYGFSSSHVWIWELDYKAECWRIDAFELWCWGRLLRVPWTARRSNWSILKESDLNIHWKDWCWSWNSNTLATWCEELTHWKRPWWWERLKAGAEGDNRGWDGWTASPTQWTWV